MDISRVWIRCPEISTGMDMGKNTWIYPNGQVCAQVCLVFRGYSSVTVQDVSLLLCFVAGNVLALFFRVGWSAELSRRLARTAVVNLMLLFLGGRINRVSNLFSLNYGTYSRVHRWAGTIAVLQALIHAGNEVRNSKRRVLSAITITVSTLDKRRACILNLYS